MFAHHRQSDGAGYSRIGRQLAQPPEPRSPSGLIPDVFPGDRKRHRRPDLSRRRSSSTGRQRSKIQSGATHIAPPQKEIVAKVVLPFSVSTTPAKAGVQLRRDWINLPVPSQLYPGLRRDGAMGSVTIPKKERGLAAPFPVVTSCRGWISRCSTCRIRPGWGSFPSASLHASSARYSSRSGPW